MNISFLSLLFIVAPVLLVAIVLGKKLENIESTLNQINDRLSPPEKNSDGDWDLD